MNLKAYKMDGLGNDFIIFDNRKKITELSKKEIVKIADRNFIGCDQLIFINKSNDYDAELDFYNSDGGQSSACGNGTRCIAYFISKEKKKEEIKKLKNLYSKPKEIPNAVRTEVAKKIEEKKIQLRDIYTSPKKTVFNKKAQRWVAIQVVKVFLGIPVVPGK